MSAWLRDPLLQFFLAGLLIFGLQGLLNPRPSPHAPPELDAEGQRRWQEQQALLAEARRLGLDRNDSLIERQLEQKMRRLIRLRAQPTQVSDATLQSFLDANAASYQEPDRIWADHLWLRRSQVANAAAAQQLLAGQTVDEAVTPAAAPSPLQQEHWDGLSRAQIRSRYGQTLAEAVDKLVAEGPWSPVVAGGLGWHRVRVQTIEPGQRPRLEDIRDRVEADWRDALAEEAMRKWLARRIDHD